MCVIPMTDIIVYVEGINECINLDLICTSNLLTQILKSMINFSCYVIIVTGLWIGAGFNS